EAWRWFEEQLVAVTGLPSWLLGFHWATTERMALQQSEILVANIESLRRHVQPQLEQLIDLRQRVAGRGGGGKVRWSKISLHTLRRSGRGEKGGTSSPARGRSPTPPRCGSSASGTSPAPSRPSIPPPQPQPPRTRRRRRWAATVGPRSHRRKDITGREVSLQRSAV